MFFKFSEAKHYHNKLVNIRNEMMMLHEKTSKLKVSGINIFTFQHRYLIMYYWLPTFILDARRKFWLQ